MNPSSSITSSHLTRTPVKISHPLTTQNEKADTLAQRIFNEQSISKQNADSKQASLRLPATNLKILISNCNNFIKIKEEAIRYLSSLNDKSRLKMEIYLQLFRELQNDPTNRIFSSNEKRAVIILILVSTTDEKKALSTNYTKADLLELISEARKMHEHCGDEVLITFTEAPEILSGPSLDDIIRALKHLSLGYQDPKNFDTLQGMLVDFHIGALTLPLI